MNAQKIIKALQGNWHGHYGTACCPAHDNPDRKSPALSVSVGEGGKLLLKCHAGCSFETILAALKRFGISDNDFEKSATVFKPFSAYSSFNRAQEILNRSVPITGTLAETYLRRERGIKGALPKTLYFCNDVYHSKQHPHNPALVALIQHPVTKEIQGVHVTFLTLDGKKSVIKPPRKIYGSAKNGCVVITDNQNPSAVIGEGVETCLSVTNALNGKASVYSCLSANGMKGFIPHPEIQQIVIATDGDAPGEKAALLAAKQLSERGLIVKIMRAPVKQDWNDVAKKENGITHIFHAYENAESFVIENKEDHETAPLDFIFEETPPAPYPVHALGALREIAEAIETVTQAPIGIAAQSVLSVAAFAVQALADAETVEGDRTPLSLYCLTIAQSGERKTACDKHALKGVKEAQRERLLHYHEEKRRYEQKKALYDADLQKIVKSSDKNKINREADLAGLEKSPAPPVYPSFLIDDPTIEGLYKSFDEGEPSKFLCTDEAGAFFGGYGMNKDNRLKTISGFSKLWNGSEVSVTRAGSPPITLYHKRLSVHFMMQPVIAQTVTRDNLLNGQGFFGRFLISYPVSKIGERLNINNDPQARGIIKAFNENVKNLVSLPLLVREGTRNQLNPRFLPLSTSAKTRLTAFYRETEAAQGKNQQYASVTPFASKAAEQAVRIAGVLTLFEDQAAIEIKESAMQNATVLTRFYLGEALRLCGESPERTREHNAEKLYLFLQKKNVKNISVRYITRNAPRCFRENETAQETLSLLEEKGFLKKNDTPQEIEGTLTKETWRMI